ncbi:MULTISPECIES: hypothetical protein [unclassified Amycolatopsis]|nr:MULTISPECIES: hypothetical protein [unclassified Amycolatopsis]
MKSTVSTAGRKAAIAREGNFVPIATLSMGRVAGHGRGKVVLRIG